MPRIKTGSHLTNRTADAKVRQRIGCEERLREALEAPRYNDCACWMARKLRCEAIRRVIQSEASKNGVHPCLLAAV